MNKNVLRCLSYGVYVVSTLDGDKPTGCIANSSMQITHDTIAVSINHDNFTNECIKKTKKFAISILSEKSDPGIIGTFGFRTGRDIDKFENIKSITVEGLNIVSDSCGYVICELTNQMETETHTIFLGKITGGELLSEDSPMTYSYYHRVLKGSSPKAAPTFIDDSVKETDSIKYKCKVCQYIYDGDITKEPDTYLCPICKQPKSVFERI